MVATLVRLRFAVLRHTLRREVWRVVLLVAGALWALLTLPSVLSGMTWLSLQQPAIAHDVLVVAGTVLLLGWAAVPVVVPGLDDSLDVRRFATSGVPPRRLVPGLLVASLLGVPTAFTAMVCLAPVVAWGGPGRRDSLVLAVLLAPVLLVTCVVTSRVTTGVAARLLGARRLREAGAVLVLAAVALTVAVVVGIGRLGLEGVLERVPQAARVLAWTPLGAGWAAPALVADGDPMGGVARAAVAVAGAVALLVVWTHLMRRALVDPPSRSGPARRRADALLPTTDGLPITRHDGHGAVAARAVLRRAVRYWSADPRYLGAMVGSVAAPVLIVLLAATVVDAPAAVALSMAPLMAGTIGWGRHNDVAYDGTAFWLHLVARAPGWADRAGRAAATLLWALPVTVVVGVVGAVVGERPDLAPASVGAALGVLGAGLGVSAVSSTVLAYPVPAAGGDPYAAQAGALGASLVAQLVTSLVTLGLCLPVLVVYGLSLWWSPDLAWATLAFGLTWGAGLVTAGVLVGGRLYDAHAVRLLPRLA